MRLLPAPCRPPDAQPPAPPVSPPADEQWTEAWPHKFEALYSITLMQPDPPEKSDVEILREAAEHYQPWKRRQQQQGGAAQPAAAAAPDARQRRQEPAADEERAPLTPSVLRCLLQVWGLRGTRSEWLRR